LLSIWLLWTTRPQCMGVACRGHWPLGTSSAKFTVYRLRHSSTNQPVVQLPGRLPDQFPKVWRSFVYRLRRLSNTYRVIVLVWLGAVRSATHSVSWASCYYTHACNFAECWQILPRDAMLAWCMPLLCVCMCICHTPVLWQNGYVAFHIFVVDEHRDFKFGVQVNPQNFLLCKC